MRILIIEDDDRISQPLAEDLRHQNHVVDIVQDGIAGWDYSQAMAYDLILLDVMLPRLDGIALCKKLRQAQVNVPILMLTAKDTIADKVAGLDAGADDYLVKPFELEELSARIRALSRRGKETQANLLAYGQLTLNPNTCEVSYGEKILSLTPKEYMILALFLKNPNRVLTRSDILEKLWDFDQSSGEGTVKTHITNLRNKLKTVSGKDGLIKTIYGIGYRLGNQP